MGYVPSKRRNSWVTPTPKKNWNNYPPELAKFYNSALWRKTSKKNLAMNPTCVECMKVGKVSRAEVTDHIIPVKQGGHKLDGRNHQSLCASCHNRKSAAEAGGVSGPFKYVGKYKIPDR